MNDNPSILSNIVWIIPSENVSTHQKQGETEFGFRTVLANSIFCVENCLPSLIDLHQHTVTQTHAQVSTLKCYSLLPLKEDEEKPKTFQKTQVINNPTCTSYCIKSKKGNSSLRTYMKLFCLHHYKAQPLLSKGTHPNNNTDIQLKLAAEANTRKTDGECSVSVAFLLGEVNPKCILALPHTSRRASYLHGSTLVSCDQSFSDQPGVLETVGGLKPSTDAPLYRLTVCMKDRI